MRRRILMVLLVGMSSTCLYAQEVSDKLRLSGSIQSDILLAEKDSVIGAEAAGGRFLTNTWNISSIRFQDKNKILKGGAFLMRI